MSHIMTRLIKWLWSVKPVISKTQTFLASQKQQTLPERVLWNSQQSSQTVYHKFCCKFKLKLCDKTFDDYYQTICDRMTCKLHLTIWEQFVSKQNLTAWHKLTQNACQIWLAKFCTHCVTARRKKVTAIYGMVD